MHCRWVHCCWVDHFLSRDPVFVQLVTLNQTPHLVEILGFRLVAIQLGQVCLQRQVLLVLSLLEEGLALLLQVLFRRLVLGSVGVDLLVNVLGYLSLLDLREFDWSLQIQPRWSCTIPDEQWK